MKPTIDTTPAAMMRRLRNARTAELRASKAFDAAIMTGAPADIARAAERLDHAQQVLYDIAAVMAAGEA